MTIRLGKDIVALTLQRNLNEQTEELSKSFERLSSGMRINHASDDPAGLALRESLRADRRIFNQAIRNVNDGISVASILDNALNELSNIAARQLELAEQAANGSLTLTQRTALHAEANALVDEFNRIVAVTEFNGKHLLNGSESQMTIQAGKQSSDTISLDLSSIISRTIGTGSFSSVNTIGSNLITESPEEYDFNGDGNLDFVVSERFGGRVRVYLGNGDGTFKAGVSYGTGALTFDPEVSDINGDGNADIIYSERYTNSIGVLLGNGDGTFKARISYSTSTINPYITSMGDINNDGVLDVVTGGFGSLNVAILIGNSNGSFKAPTLQSVITSGPSTSPYLADINYDGRDDLMVADSGGDQVRVYLSNGDGTFSFKQILTTQDAPVDLIAGDLNGDGYLDLVSANFQANNSVSIFFGNSDGTFQAATNYTTQSAGDVELADINEDGHLDIVAANDENSLSVLINNGNGTFQSQILTDGLSPTSYQMFISIGDFTGDGILDVLGVTSEYSPEITIFVGASDETTQQPDLYLLTQEGATAALDSIQETIDLIIQARGRVSAFESRLNYSVNYLSVMSENFAAAESRISDADVAAEVANMIRLQILQQANTALLAQANQNYSIVLTLLGES